MELKASCDISVIIDFIIRLSPSTPVFLPFLMHNRCIVSFEGTLYTIHQRNRMVCFGNIFLLTKKWAYDIFKGKICLIYLVPALGSKAYQHGLLSIGRDLGFFGNLDRDSVPWLEASV